MRFLMVPLWAVLVSMAFGAAGVRSALAQSGTLQVGYVVVTHEEPTTKELTVFETFGEVREGETTQAGVLPSVMSTKAFLFASINRNLARDLGVAVANVGNTDASLRLFLNRENGSSAGVRTLTLPARNQTSQFVTQLFSDLGELDSFVGSLIIESNVPVAIVGLRFRGPNFSTVPIINMGPNASVPVRESGIGGGGSWVLPQFALGGGWGTEVVLANYENNNTHDLRVDFFRQDGTPMIVTLNGETKSTFNFKMGPAAVATLSARDATGNSIF